MNIGPGKVGSTATSAELDSPSEIKSENEALRICIEAANQKAAILINRLGPVLQKREADKKNPPPNPTNLPTPPTSPIGETLLRHRLELDVLHETLDTILTNLAI